MKKLAEYMGLTVSLDDEGKVVLDGTFDVLASTSYTEKSDPAQWKMRIRYVLKKTDLSHLIDRAGGNARIATQNGFKAAKSGKSILSYVEKLPVDDGVSTYTVPIENASQNPIGQNTFAALSAKAEKLNDPDDIRAVMAAMQARLDEIENKK